MTYYGGSYVKTSFFGKMNCHSKNGFSLLEVLVALAIIGLFASSVFTVLGSSTNYFIRTSHKEEARQISQANFRNQLAVFYLSEKWQVPPEGMTIDWTEPAFLGIDPNSDAPDAWQIEYEFKMAKCGKPRRPKY